MARGPCIQRWDDFPGADVAPFNYYNLSSGSEIIPLCFMHGNGSPQRVRNYPAVFYAWKWSPAAGQKLSRCAFYAWTLLSSGAEIIPLRFLCMEMDSRSGTEILPLRFYAWKWIPAAGQKLSRCAVYAWNSRMEYIKQGVRNYPAALLCMAMDSRSGA